VGGYSVDNGWQAKVGCIWGFCVHFYLGRQPMWFLCVKQK
jgi:hypothetical protein